MMPHHNGQTVRFWPQGKETPMQRGPYPARKMQDCELQKKENRGTDKHLWPLILIFTNLYGVETARRCRRRPVEGNQQRVVALTPTWRQPHEAFRGWPSSSQDVTAHPGGGYGRWLAAVAAGG